MLNNSHGSVTRCYKSLLAYGVYVYIMVYMNTKKRTNIYLTLDQHKALAALSEKTGASVAELVRRAVDADLLSADGKATMQEKVDDFKVIFNPRKTVNAYNFELYDKEGACVFISRQFENETKARNAAERLLESWKNAV